MADFFQISSDYERLQILNRPEACDYYQKINAAIEGQPIKKKNPGIEAGRPAKPTVATRK